MDESERDRTANFDLDDGNSMKDVYGSAKGFYDNLVATATCAYPRLDDGSWMEKLRFLTPMGRTNSDDAGPVQSPGKGEDRTHCRCTRHRFRPFTGTETYRLRLTSFKEVVDCQHYVAVSYCWSSSLKEDGPWRDKAYEIVTPHGCRPNRAPYQVIKRAIDYAALRRLPFIWIDQECINQDDEAEKRAQVDEMDRIYRRASKVIAVLAATIDEPDLLEALELLITRQPRRRQPMSLWFPHRLGELIAADPWFYRAWTWQENMQAARVLDMLVPLTGWSRKRYPHDTSWLLEDCALLSQNSLEDLASLTGSLDTEKEGALRSGMPDYKIKDQALAGDLTRHRLSSFDALSSIIGMGLTIPTDRMHIIANIAAYRLRIDHIAARRLGRGIATSVFTQALLNGDMSLLLAYRKFLDWNDPRSRQLFGLSHDKSLTTMMLSTRNKIENWIPVRNTYRSRTLPISLQSDGLRVRGQLWARAKWSMDGHAVVSSLRLSREFSRLVLGTSSESSQAQLFAPLDKQARQIIWWSEEVSPAPQFLFVASRVLLDREDTPEHFLVWTVSAVLEDLHPQLVLDDNFPRKIPVLDDYPVIKSIHAYPGGIPQDPEAWGQEYVLNLRL